MGRSIQQLPNTNPPTPAKPYGSIKDRVGSTPGTAVNHNSVDDQFQFFNRIMDLTGFTFNGVDEGQSSGSVLREFQLVRAISKYIDSNNKEARIKITQTGTNTPVVTTGKNNLLDATDTPIVFVPVRSGAGIYKLTFVPDSGKDYILIVSSGTLSDVSNDIDVTMRLAEGNQINITSKLSGLNSDGVLDHTFILKEIKTGFVLGEF